MRSGLRWIPWRSAAIRGAYAATEPPPPVFQALLVLPARLSRLDGAGRTAGRLSTAAHRPHPRSGPESVFANSGAAAAADAGFRTSSGFAIFCSSKPAQRLVGCCFCADFLYDFEGPFRLRRNVSGELCRLRHGHRPAQRASPRDPAPLGGILSAIFNRHLVVSNRERRRACAVRDVERAGGVPAAILYLHLHRLRGHWTGQASHLG